MSNSRVRTIFVFRWPDGRLCDLLASLKLELLGILRAVASAPHLASVAVGKRHSDSGDQPVSSKDFDLRHAGERAVCLAPAGLKATAAATADEDWECNVVTNGPIGHDVCKD